MPETVFSITSTTAMVAWVALIAARFIPAFRRWVDPAVGYVVPALLSVAYGVLLLGYWGQSEGGGFVSLASVTALFAVPELLLAGWIHYLAFDLFVGAWIARNGSVEGVSPLVLTPILLATFLAGPIGYLAYALLRPVISKKSGS
jgi:hypothetical protein